MQQQGTIKRLLTVDETASILSMSRSSLYRLIFAGELASLKIGGKRRISVSALDRYLARLEAECDPQNGL